MPTKKLPICSKCTKEAVIFIRYAGTNLCSTHFNQFVERRVKHELSSQIRFPTRTESTVAVALSGGKDSSITLTLMHKIFKFNRRIQLIPVLIDEGIKNYRDKCIESATKLCATLDGLDLHIVKFEAELGYTLDTIVQRQQRREQQQQQRYQRNNNKYTSSSACSYCGVFRRYLLNRYARDILNAKVVVLGLNLDDYIQSILMNITKGDVIKLVRLGPHHRRIYEGLVPRIMPLRRIPEQESFLYAVLNEIPAYHGSCPYAEASSRNFYRQLLYQLESNSPGCRFAILNFYERILDSLYTSYPITTKNRCRRCNEPSAERTTLCRACKLIDSLQQK